MIIDETVGDVVFAIEGELRVAEKTTMLEFYNKITPSTWSEICVETITYKIFLECLINHGLPAIGEKVTAEDQKWLSDLEKSVTEMAVIDKAPFLLIDQENLKKQYVVKMEENAKAILAEIDEVRKKQDGGLAVSSL